MTSRISFGETYWLWYASFGSSVPVDAGCGLLATVESMGGTVGHNEIPICDEQCFEDARRDIVIDQVIDLTDANLLILWAAATNQSDLTKDIYERYCQFSQRYGIKPFSYMYFYTNLGYLQSVGLLALVATKIDRAYTNRVILTFDRSITEQICRLRFE